MEIEIEITRNDYVQFADYVIWKKKLGTGFNIVAYFVFLFLVIFNHYKNISSLGEFIAQVIIFSLLFWLFLFLARLVDRLVHRSTPLDKGMALGRHFYQADDDGFREITKYSDLLVKWPGVKSIEQNRKIMIVFLDRNNGCIIPKRFFPSERDAQAFFDKMTELIANAKYKEQPNL